MQVIKKLISYLFYSLLFITPLILWPATSEIFEFNKIIATYIITTLIIGLWSINMILEKRIIFRRTILDVPIIIFLVSQIISTILSIDTRTSYLGYYSRFNGGLTSSIVYSLLYWAFVSNMNKKTVKFSFNILLFSGLLVCSYAILEHFGIDKNLWIQDVQNRVFSTLGQPNWLAAWICALIPLTWSFLLLIKIENENIKSATIDKKFWYYLFLSGLFFISLLYTKSRSGILGFIIANGFYWILITWFIIRQKFDFKKILVIFVVCHLLFIAFALVIGTPWTPNLSQLIKQKQQTTLTEDLSREGPALEIGGSSSIEIRKIVWRGAIDVWRHYPVFGSGVETFAFSYYKFRPAEHNLVSEWDFLYNKAHNEYLNYMATTGTVGFLSYGSFIVFALFIFFKNILSPSFFPKTVVNSKNKYLKLSDTQSSLSDDFDNKLINIALVSGWSSILVTNFFGFSVVPVSILFFLFPAMAVSIGKEKDEGEKYEDLKPTSFQKTGIIVTGIFSLIILSSIFRYWYTDILYARAKAFGDGGNPISAITILQKVVKSSPDEAIFWSELATNQSEAAIGAAEAGNTSILTSLINSSITNSQKAIDLSPANVNLKRNQARIYVNFSAFDPNFLLKARDVLLNSIEQAPTDAKIYYNLALVYLRSGDIQKSEEILKEAIKLKDNYRDARYALALISIDKKDFVEAKNQLEYILSKINPGDTQAKEALKEIK